MQVVLLVQVVFSVLVLSVLVLLVLVHAFGAGGGFSLWYSFTRSMYMS